MPENHNQYGKTLLKWEIPEYEKYPHSTLWFIIMGGIGLGLFITAVWTFNFLFATIIIIIAVIIIIHEKRQPDKLLFKIMEDGIILDQAFVSYKEIKKFWIIYEPPETKNLYFNIKRALRPELSVPLINMNPVVVRRILLDYLKEDLTQKDISTDDSLSRLLQV